MGKTIQVAGSSVQDAVPVRRRNTQGARTANLSVTIPKELNSKLEDLMVKTNKTKSLIITELVEKGLEA